MTKILALPPEIIKKEDGRYYKNCPECGKECSYLRKNYAIESFRLKKLCKTCSNRKPEKNTHLGYYKKIRLSWFNSKQKDALLRGYIWELTPEILWQRYLDQRGKCILSGVELTWYDGEAKDSNCSIDRIDSSKDYTEDNIQLIHKHLNFMKQHFSQSYFIEMCKLVTAHNRV